MSSKDQEHLVPSHPKDRKGSSSSGSDVEQYSSFDPSRPGSSKAVSYLDFTPRRRNPTIPTNPFSPPASPTASKLDQTSAASIGHHAQSSVSGTPETVPRSGFTSLSTSAGDLTRSHNFGSRPGTAGTVGTRPPSSRAREPFMSPPMRPLTMYSSMAGVSSKIQKERPKSTMLPEDSPLEKLWLTERVPYARFAYLLTYGMVLLGVIGGAVQCFFGWRNVHVLEDKNLCLVLNENFDSPDSVFGTNGTFFREVDMSGFGNGEFEMTTDSTNNSYVSNGKLYITPTLTSDVIGLNAVENGYVFNITGCTFNMTQGDSYTAISQDSQSTSAFNTAAYYKACSAVSNSTLGTIINPIQTARLTTKQRASIKYGRVEVNAKLPRGDWLWPAIWMLPVENKYGPWPVSGEIDIMESRGNGPDYPFQGVNYVRGTLNWGPASWLNAGWRTFGWWPMKRGSFADTFHTYTVEWDEEFLRIYVDTRLRHMLQLNFNVPFYNRGNFPSVVQNGTETVILSNPWANSTNAAPFDQSFYLVLSLGVGGTNGWFPDEKNKPWLDGSNTAMGDFWRTRDQWLPTWSTNAEDKSLVVDSVKMWQKC
ncbi:hypothetical protein AX15_007847 [Amanita polypyramis BW_CC]|nr:hypothetical protein AX15_007847 [Amanita polypyramis BW_CC]